jgi:hypothetical protein
LSPDPAEYGDIFAMPHRIFPALVLLIVLGACVPGGTYQVAPVSLSLTATSQRSVVAAVTDQRPYVLSGEQSASFLGTERGNWGGEKKISTESGRDLAEVIDDAVVQALASRGIAASALLPVADAAVTDTLSAFKAQGADRLLVVEIHDWRTDINTRIVLRWRLEALVYDQSGNVLARTDSQGVSPVGRTTLTSDNATVAIDELSGKLSTLLNERVITEALR